jgi:hypothetical protein
MPKTYEAIATNTLGSTTTTLTFSSIPSTYTDLVIIANLGSVSAGNVQIQFNGDTATNYSAAIMYTTGAAAGAGPYANLSFAYGLAGAASLPSTISSSGIININNYSNTTTWKNTLCRYGNSNQESTCFVGTWRNTAAINSVTLSSYSGAYLTGSSFTLYGIQGA